MADQPQTVPLFKQHQDESLWRADQLLAALPDEYFPSGAASSSTPQCRCHLSRHSSQPLGLLQNYPQSPGSLSFSCSSLLSFSDSTDASSRNADEKQLAEAARQFSLARREETQLRGQLADLDDRLARLRDRAGGERACMLLTLRRVSVERLLAGLASRADAKAKEIAALKEQRKLKETNRKGSNCDDKNLSDSGSDSETSDDF
ncbi:hypothetical protein BOX15_Mlig019448g3 [Macrostomum lignano]|uniref:Uncharacterized protein n=1 Tax=Macrostomum lignano TaxID=282301 RepID=A0A267DFY7_9PLAT|nr:hypothetical protein BOX15_Mlig019448g3 [Macrostomum lignano]